MVAKGAARVGLEAACKPGGFRVARAQHPTQHRPARIALFWGGGGGGGGGGGEKKKKKDARVGLLRTRDSSPSALRRSELVKSSSDKGFSRDAAIRSGLSCCRFAPHHNALLHPRSPPWPRPSGLRFFPDWAPRLCCSSRSTRAAILGCSFPFQRSARSCPRLDGCRGSFPSRPLALVDGSANRPDRALDRILVLRPHAAARAGRAGVRVGTSATGSFLAHVSSAA